MFWAAVWLAILLVAIKAFYLGTPASATPHAAADYVRDLAAVSFVDVLFAAMLWICGNAAEVCANMNEIWPPSRSLIAGAPPL